MPLSAQDLTRCAGELADADGRGLLIDPPGQRFPGFDMADGYRVLAILRDRRVSSGWTPAGRKIGFTNRNIWPLYGVDRPMWAHVYDRTVRHFRGDAGASIAGLVQPRIEPEICFLFRSAPASRDSRDLLAAIAWFAPAFEIVHCHYPDWRFSAADSVADYGLHGRLLVGPPCRTSLRQGGTVEEQLATFTVDLSRNGSAVRTGKGGHVLGSPLLALSHLLEILAGQPAFAPLAGGEIVTTGTLTDAHPVEAGETWCMTFAGIGLERFSVTLAI